MSEKYKDYANSVVEQLRDAGVIARADLRDEKVNYKVRDLSLAKTPIIYQLSYSPTSVSYLTC